MALCAVAFLSTPASAQVPQLLNYQGRIAVDGVNYAGPTGKFYFALVDGGTNTSVPAAGLAVRTGGFITSVTVTAAGAGYTTLQN